MHNKLSKEGLAIISVDLDNPDSKKRREEVLTFLKEKKATFINVALTEGEDPAEVAEKLGFDAVPYGEVYDREGKLVKKFTDGIDHKELDKLVAELLKKK